MVGQLDMDMDGHIGVTHIMDILTMVGVTLIMVVAIGPDTTMATGMDIMPEVAGITRAVATILNMDIVQLITPEEEVPVEVQFQGQVVEDHQLAKQRQEQVDLLVLKLQ